MSESKLAAWLVGRDSQGRIWLQLDGGNTQTMTICFGEDEAELMASQLSALAQFGRVHSAPEEGVGAA